MLVFPTPQPFLMSYPLEFLLAFALNLCSASRTHKIYLSSEVRISTLASLFCFPMRAGVSLWGSALRVHVEDASGGIPS